MREMLASRHWFKTYYNMPIGKEQRNMPICHRLTPIHVGDDVYMEDCGAEATHMLTIISPDTADVSEVVCDAHARPETAPEEGETWTAERLHDKWLAGYEAGFARATHIEPTPTQLLRLNTFGIGEVLAHWPCPAALSGEWAGEPMPELGIEDEDDAEEYESGFFAGWCDGVLNHAARVGQ